MTSPNTPADTAVRPLKLPKFTLIIGGEGAEDLTAALIGPNFNARRSTLHRIGEDIAGCILGVDHVEDIPDTIPEGIPTEDFVRDLDSFLCETLGDDYAARGFKAQLDLGVMFDPEDEFVFPDATIHDVEPFVEHFGKENVLVIFTGAISVKLDVNCIWLTHTDLSERLAQIKRIVGEA